MHNINNTPPTPRGTFPPSRTVFAPAPRTAPEPDGMRISPDHVFPGRPEGSVRLEAFRELAMVVADLERRVRVLEAESDASAHGARG